MHGRATLGGLSRDAASACAFALLAGCTQQPYVPAPIDAGSATREFDARTSDTAGLRAYMADQGHATPEWPLPRWQLAELTLAAFYFNPELAVARAQARAARAQVAVATQRPPIGFKPLASHHSRNPDDVSSAWSLGFELELPLFPTSQREAPGNRYGALADAAALSVGDVAWKLRSAVRANLLDLHAGRVRHALLEEETVARREMTDLLERRVTAGVAAATASTAARLDLVRAEGESQSAQAAADRSLAELAQAIGLPLARVRELALDFAVFEAPLPAPDSVAVQRDALLNRIDVRAKLLEYAAAEADVQLEVARQVPAISLRPSYLWD